jgi:hypothetical protein
MAQALPIHPTKRHPLTGEPIRALWITPRGRICWPIMGGDETAGQGGESGGSAGGGEAGGASAEAGSGAGQGATPGFPANTPVEQMNADQRAAYYQHQAQKWQGRAENNYGLLRNLGVTSAEDAAAIKQKVEQHDALEHELMSDKDKAVAEAATQAANEAAAKYAPLLVRAEFKAALKGRVEDSVLDARLETITDPLDLSKFLTDSGEVDAAKVSAFVEEVAPAKGTAPKGPVVPPRGTGGSSGGSGTALTGREMYEQRHRKKSA